ncbi:MAG TPA: methyltransferase [Verrucomicrobiae bacterium]|jgi:SAM-dependent methyltransferase|nr:methyltransferase [Verrucomicrobiae bacterium]
MLPESISYYFFKRTLRKKLDSLYEMSDPWGAEFVRDFFVLWIRDQMKAMPESALRAPLLDAGGGEGHYYAPLKDLIREYHLLDMSVRALSRGRESIKSGIVRTIPASLDQLAAPADTYGTIWLFSVLTYLGEIRFPRTFRRTLEKLWKALRPGGRILLIHPYYSEEERKRIVRYGEIFAGFGGKLISNEDKSLGRQQFIVQAVAKE